MLSISGEVHLTGQQGRRDGMLRLIATPTAEYVSTCSDAVLIGLYIHHQDHISWFMAIESLTFFCSKLLTKSV